MVLPAIKRAIVAYGMERDFRVLKNDIGIAPVHHRLPQRIRAHALICSLALALPCVMRRERS